MAISRAGFNRIAIFNKDGSVSNIITTNLREKASLTFTPVGEKDARNRQFRDFLKAKLEYPIRDIVAKAPYAGHRLYYLIQHAINGGVSAEIVSANDSASTYDGVFKFFADNFLGLEFDYFIGSKKRGINITCERNFPHSVAQAIIDAAQLNTLETLGGLPLTQNDIGRYVAPQFEFITYNEGVSTISLTNAEEIVDRQLSIKTLVNNKNEMEIPFIDGFEISLDITMRNATKAKLQELYGLANWCPKIVIREGNGENYEEHEFASGLLSFSPETVIADDDRNIKLSLTGTVDSVFKVAYTNPTSDDNHKFTWGL